MARAALMNRDAIVIIDVSKPDLKVQPKSSKLDVTKDSLVSSEPGQFHRVLVEPEYSVLQPTIPPPTVVSDVKPTIPPPNIVSDVKQVEESHEDNPERVAEDEKPTQSIEKPLDTLSGDNQVITNYSDEELKEASRAIVERSIEEAVKIVGKNANTGLDIDNETGAVREKDTTVQAEEVANNSNEVKDVPIELDTISLQCRENQITDIKGNQQNITTDIDAIKAEDQLISESKLSLKKEKKNKKIKAKEQNLREREIIDSVKEFIKEEDTKSKEKEKRDGKKGIGFPSMFKFSKRKQKADVEVTSSGSDTKSDVKGTNKITEVSDDQNGFTEDQNPSDKLDTAPDQQVTAGDQRGVRRLNSLDSGIVVDKFCDTMNGVEYSVVNKTKKNNVLPVGNVSNGVAQVASNINGNTTKLSDPEYVNGEKTDEDFVYINERAIDVVNADDEAHKANDVADVDEKTVAKKESGETGAASTVKKVDQIRRTEKYKIKKKSWSFNIGGSKKTESDPAVDGAVSMDPNVSDKESTGSRKTRWGFGKFSFRKAEDLSASTPDLNKESSIHKSKSSIESEVSESPEHVTDKKKGTKLKKIKAKKEKKQKLKEAQKSIEGEMSGRSSSMFNIPVGANQPRSRRSIVEDEINYTQTDAFEGVAVSDLSQDEDDVQVSLDPSGAKSAKVSGEIIGPTQTEMKELKADTVNLIDDSSGGGVYVNITKDELVNTDFEKEQGNTLPSKYIYAGDDEYAQIVKSDTAKETVGEKQKGSVNVIQSDDKDVSDTTKQRVTVDKETEEIAQNSTVPIEESITDETVSALECKAAPDAYETTSLGAAAGEDINEAEVKNTDNGQHKTTAAYSNVIYSDVSFEPKLKEKQSKESEILPDSESDGYVQLEQLVKDHDSVAKTDRPVNLDIIVADKSRINLQDCETENLKSDEPVTPVSPTVVSRASIKLSFKPKVIIMKEVGVQAPDIHMPLDKEFDFGFIKGKPNVVSIGVQVSDSPGITVDKSHDKEDCSTSVTPTAYF